MKHAAANPEAPRVVIRDPDDHAVALLHEAQLVMLKYPSATQAAFRSLVAEGRRFAQTPEGRRWKTRLGRSELMRRGRVLWESSAFGMLEESGDSPLPSALLDALVHALASRSWPALVAQIAERLQEAHGKIDAA